MDLYEFLSFHVSIDLARLRDRKEKPSQGVNRARKKNILLRRLRRAMKMARKGGSRLVLRTKESEDWVRENLNGWTRLKLKDEDWTFDTSENFENGVQL